MPEMTCGIVGVFATADALLKAVARVRAAEEAESRWEIDAHTPYPVHGLAKALGLPRSPLGYLVLCGGLCGVFGALALQGFTNAIDYPQIIGGKPPFAWPAFVPIIFELMVLISAFTAFFGMLGALNRLPYFGHPLLKTAAIKTITRDRFGLVLLARKGEPFDAAFAQALLKAAGAETVEQLSGEQDTPAAPAGQVPFAQFGIIAATVALVTAAGWMTHWAIKIWPEMAPNVYLHEQNKLLPYAAEPFFLDGHAMRIPPDGAVARGKPPYPYQAGVHDELAGQVLSNPLPFSEPVVQRGRVLFERFCMVCHGVWGDGKKQMSEQYLARPANLQSARICEMPEGRLFHVITAGKGLMPGYQSQIEPDERWAVIHYLRVLQRAANASDADLEHAFRGYNVIEAQPSTKAQEAK